MKFDLSLRKSSKNCTFNSKKRPLANAGAFSWKVCFGSISQAHGCGSVTARLPQEERCPK